jgi:hypothetical protein
VCVCWGGVDDANDHAVAIDYTPKALPQPIALFGVPLDSLSRRTHFLIGSESSLLFYKNVVVDVLSTFVCCSVGVCV